MHLTTILAFAILFWRAEISRPWLIISHRNILATLLLAIGQPVVIFGLAWLCTLYTKLSMRRTPGDPGAAQLFHHRCLVVLRAFSLICFGVTVMTTPWSSWFAFHRIHPAFQIFGDLVVLLPFFASVFAIWLAVFRVEQALRGEFGETPIAASSSRGRLGAYLDFNIRHQVLVVAVPMILILFAADLTRGYESSLQVRTGVIWAPDVLLGFVALLVFVVSPVLLRRIWRTTSLNAGPLRTRLEAVCSRIKLRFRDILVWHSDGMMINAAVMGLFAPVRYVMLSDALLQTMDDRQIEAVFGHEAGHIRHRHIQHFLVFAFVGWLIVAGAMEFLASVVGARSGRAGLSAATIQAIGVAGTVILWAVGFGWLSRRFERQADLFGARCVTPDFDHCRIPCSIHGDENGGQGHQTGGSETRHRVCSTGTSIFASALDRVAVLNGIPHEEKSWRHSSIGSRIRFLASLAGDPKRVERFERLIRRIKLGLLGMAAIGSIAAVTYSLKVQQPAIFRIQAVSLPEIVILD